MMVHNEEAVASDPVPQVEPLRSTPAVVLRLSVLSHVRRTMRKQRPVGPVKEDANCGCAAAIPFKSHVLIQQASLQ